MYSVPVRFSPRTWDGCSTKRRTAPQSRAKRQRMQQWVNDETTMSASSLCLESVRELQTQAAAVLLDRVLAVLRAGGIGVRGVRQVVEAGRDLQSFDQVQRRQGQVRHDERR